MTVGEQLSRLTERVEHLHECMEATKEEARTTRKRVYEMEKNYAVDRAKLVTIFAIVVALIQFLMGSGAVSLKNLLGD